MLILMSAVDIEQMSADGTVAPAPAVVFVDGERMMPKRVLCFGRAGGSVRDSLDPTIHLARPLTSISPKSGQGLPKVSPKSFKSRPKVDPRSAPNQNQKVRISTSGSAAKILDGADGSAVKS